MKLFLSYNSLDNYFVRAIKDKLVHSGFTDQFEISFDPGQSEIFFDKDSLIPGDDWVKAIGDALKHSDTFLFFVSENGIGKWQRKEAIIATSECTKSKTSYKIIPVIIANRKGEIKRDLPWFLTDYQWVEFADADDDRAFENLLKGLRNSQDEKVMINPKNPYKGLNVFEVNDAPYFFGRTADINWVFYKKLKLHSNNYASNFLAIVGDSGTGKSSFVNAGLLYALKNGKYQGSENWKYIMFKPGKDPINELSTTLEREKVIKSFSVFEKEIEEDTYGNYLNSIVKIYGQKIILFIDQFEEIITQCKDENERKIFLLTLANATNSGKLLILITLRSDYYSSFADHVSFKELLENNNYTLSGIDIEKQSSEHAKQTIKDIIEKPALLQGVHFEKELVDQLVKDIQPVKGALPVLQLSLFKLWNNDTIADGKISLNEYNTLSEAKGIEGIIEIHANDVFDKICPEGEQSKKGNLFRDLLLQLVELTESHEDVRRTLEKQKLIGNLQVYNKEEIEDIIKELSGEESRILTISKKADKKDNIDIVHEVLIRKWVKLKNWIDENRTALKYKEQIERVASEANSKKERYYSDKKLKAAVLWQKAYPNLSTKEIEDFILRSRKKIFRKRVSIAVIMIFLSLLASILYPYYTKHQHKIACVKSQFYSDVLKANLAQNANEVKRIRTTGDRLLDLQQYCDCFPNVDSLQIGGVAKIEDISKLKIANRIKTLVIYNSYVQLKGISALKELESLTSLSLSSNQITDVSALKELESLTSLNLSSNQITDISALKKLKNLTDLELNNNNQITDISTLKELKSLTKLNLSGNRITDISALKELKKLTQLDMSGNRNITDISTLKELKKLTALNLSANNIKDVSALKELKNLTELDLSVDPIKDISALKELRSLTFLRLYNNSITDISALKELENLTELDLSNNPITDISTLKELKKLIKLYLGGIQITDIGALKELKKLTALDLSVNNIKDVFALKELKSLTFLSLPYNQITDISALKELKNLIRLNLSNNPITDISTLKELKNLTELDLSGDPIKDISALKELKNLTRLNLFAASIIDVNVLKQLKNLTELNLRDNQISEILLEDLRKVNPNLSITVEE